MIISGKALKVGDNVDTDLILPSRYLVLTDPSKLAEHAMEGVDPDFSKKAKNGIILVAGKNFGCGSSREQAPIALKHSGVKCVIAESFARIFYRNAINIGLPAVECKGIARGVEAGDELMVKVEEGSILNKSKDVSLKSTPLPDFLLEVLKEGGIINYLKKRKET
jgi:3-isopropylmalate/(R)-2-methylmalate dehydratase small subunit